MTQPVIIIGAGGHAKVVIETLQRSSVGILGATDADPNRHGQAVLGVPVLGGDDVILAHEPGSVCLANGIGSTTDTSSRRNIFERFKDQGYSFITLIHPAAIVAEDVQIGEGSQVMAGAVVQPGTRIGNNCIINTRASIDHDCTIGDHVHIAPGAVLSGGVVAENGVHVGTGAAVIHDMRIGQQSIIGAGAAVVQSVGANEIVTGVPAKAI